MRIPRGRATVNDFAGRAKQSQETCQNAVQLLNAREKAFRPQTEFPRFEIPSPSLPSLVAEEVMGF